MGLENCFIRDERDQELLTLCVGRVYPHRAVFAVSCNVKGSNGYYVHRLAAFLQKCNFMHDEIVPWLPPSAMYKSDS